MKTAPSTTIQDAMAAAHGMARAHGWSAWKVELAPSDTCDEAVEMHSVIESVEEILAHFEGAPRGHPHLEDGQGPGGPGPAG